MKYAIIDMGGGMRGAFGAGVYDALMDRNMYPFDLAVGVSAGASNLVTYLSGQRGRVLRYYTVYPHRKEYIGLYALLHSGNYINLKYVYETLSFPNGEDPFDFHAYINSRMDMYFVSTDARTGKPVYFPKTSISEWNMKALEASAAVPVACKPVLFEGRRYYDGGVSDPLPFRKAFELGAEKIVAVMTKPKDFERNPEKDRIPARIISVKYPQAGKALAARADTYNRELRAMRELEKEGKILILAPESTEGIDTMKYTDEGIMKLYESGYRQASMIDGFLNM